ncbi:MAG: bifunctional diaminohydroxyphosphoribosylaminopyrimidine deaminase/5-amino-6-(5-phosphoribosylamino)uracil reductase RibD [Acidobacteriota bacterium]
MDAAREVAFLRRALRLAAKGRFGVSPNPMVGAVLVRDGEIVGEGWHQRPGEPHAEALAIAAAGDRAHGATLFVTLEPCAHHGRTPPCATAVAAAGIARVVACHRDPDPRVAGRGFAILEEAGVPVTRGVLAEEAVRLNWKFMVNASTSRPAVTLKWAMSLDGKIATASGKSQWISSLEGRRFGMRLREEHDAILVGSGTVMSDDPRLDRRLQLASGPNLRVVLDRRLRTAPERRLFTVEGPLLIYTLAVGDERFERASNALVAAGASVIALPEVTPGSVLADLYQRGVRSVLVEGGSRIASAFVRAQCYDRVAVDCSPKLLGGAEAPGVLAEPVAMDLATAPYVEDLRAARAGSDIVLEGFRSGCLADLYSHAAG